VRRIFREYANGQSLKAIAHALNHEGVPFPAKDTKRGPARLGWAVSTIAVILRNEKYAGTWVWNKTRFLKDPDSGRRRPIDRPRDEWVTQERPELRIIEPRLWQAVQARQRAMEERFGCGPGAAHAGRHTWPTRGTCCPVSCAAACAGRA
jgi:site-specific DNA recombinase